MNRLFQGISIFNFRAFIIEFFCRKGGSPPIRKGTVGNGWFSSCATKDVRSREGLVRGRRGGLIQVWFYEAREYLLEILNMGICEFVCMQFYEGDGVVLIS